MNISIFEVIYRVSIFTSLLCNETLFLERYVPGRVEYYILMVPILWGLFDGFYSRHSKIYIKDCIFVIPFMGAILWSIIQYCFIASNDMMMNSIIYWLIPIILAFLGYIRLGKNVIKITMQTIIANYIVVILYSIYKNGLRDFTFEKIFGDNFGSSLEVHTIGLSVGLYVIYCVILREKQYLILSIICMVLCGKRIAIAAVVVSLIVYFIQKRFKLLKALNITIFSILIVVIAYVYIYMIKNNIFENILMDFSINSMSRDVAWGYLSQWYIFSPTFLGLGLGGTMNLLRNGVFANGILVQIQDAHNDILKLYIDLGFIPFIIFLLFLSCVPVLYYLSNKMYKSSIIYLSILTYVIIEMFTDNVIRYSIFLIIFCLICIDNVQSKKHKQFDNL